MKFIDQYWMWSDQCFYTLSHKRTPAIHFNLSTIYVQTTSTEHQAVKTLIDVWLIKCIVHYWMQ